MRPTKDADHTELKSILATLLADDIDVSVREVARRHTTLKAASAFTRNPARMALIEQAKHRQSDARNVKTGPEQQRAKGLTETLEERTRRVTELELRVRQLVASHTACIRAVMMHGGMASLERFWADYKSVADGLKVIGALPESTDVVVLANPASRGFRQDK